MALRCPFAPRVPQSAAGSVVQAGAGRAPKLPGLGWGFRDIRPFRRDPIAFFQSLTGKGSLVPVYLGSPTVVVNDPRGIKRMLEDASPIYQRGKIFKRIEIMIGETMINTEGERWERYRKTVEPAFRLDRRFDYLPSYLHSARQQLEHWEEKCRKGEPIDIFREMLLGVLRMSGPTLFSSDLSTSEVEEINDVFAEVIVVLHDRMWDTIAWPADMPFANRRMKRVLEKLDIVLERLMRPKRSVDKPDLIDLTHELPGMNVQRLREQVRGWILGSHETTGSSLAWALHLLSLNPEVDRMAYAEIAALPADPTLEDLLGSRFAYNRNVQKEALRLLSPVWITYRVLAEDDVLCGYRLPKGTKVMASQYAVHRDPAIWGDPEVFRPERFRGRVEQEGQRTYFPFVTGPRACCGQNVAMQEMSVMLLEILRRFRIRPDPSFTVIPEANLTLRPRGGIRVYLEPRE